MVIECNNAAQNSTRYNFIWDTTLYKKLIVTIIGDFRGHTAIIGSIVNQFSKIENLSRLNDTIHNDW